MTGFFNSGNGVPKKADTPSGFFYFFENLQIEVFGGPHSVFHIHFSQIDRFHFHLDYPKTPKKANFETS